MRFFQDLGHCPKCGKFCGKIQGEGNEYIGLAKVTGVCKVHGEVDLSSQSWGYEDFFSEENTSV